MYTLRYDYLTTARFLFAGDMSLNWNRPPATVFEAILISFGLVLIALATGLVVDFFEHEVGAAAEALIAEKKKEKE
jgi:hypothetical protein